MKAREIATVARVAAAGTGLWQVRLHAAGIASRLQPGHWLRLGENAVQVFGWQGGLIDCLLRAPTPPETDAEVAIEGPCGESFELGAPSPRALILVDDAALGAAVTLVRALRVAGLPRVKPLVLVAATPELPFRPAPSRMIIPGIPADVIAAVPMLDDWAVPSRVAGDGPGLFGGPLTALADHWLATLQGAADVTVYAAGSAERLHAWRTWAMARGLACQAVSAPA